MSVMVVGPIGVWRCTQLDFTSEDKRVMEEMALEEKPFQPEIHDFCVAEVSRGVYMCDHNYYYWKISQLN